MRNSKLVGISLALLISVGVISGCSENTPNMTSALPGNNSQIQPGAQSQTNSSSNTASGNTVSSQPSASGTVQNQNNTASSSAKVASSTEAKDAMSSYNDDEVTFADSESIANDNFSAKSFSTKGVLGKIATAIGVRAKVRKDLVDSGAVTIKADGNITVDSAKLATERNKLKVKLKAVKDVLKEKVKNLKRKGNLVKTSETNTVDNGDGTKTETITVMFKNESSNVIRENVVTKTTNTSDGKLVSSDHSLTVTYKEYTRVSTRLVTIDETGAKKVITDSTTTWKNGKKRVVHEERNLDASGNGTGVGSIVITTKDGKTKTYNLNATITGAVATNSSAIDTATNTEVKVEAGSDTSTATATVVVDGQTQTTEQVNLDSSVTASADANITTDSSATVDANVSVNTSI